ncbi:MAG: asparagine synthase-related protein [Gammaproteobacteria bacterium]
MGFLALLRKTSADSTLSSIFREAAEPLGPGSQVQQVGRLDVATDRHSAVTDTSGDVRILLGRNSEAHAKSDFRAALLALQGSFATLFCPASRDGMQVARDRFGAVPVYYVDTPAFLAVSTRLACLLPFADERRLGRGALLESLRFRWITGRHTLCAGVSLLGAGESLTWSRTTGGLQLKTWAPLEFTAEGPEEMDAQSQLLASALREAIGFAIGSSRKPAILLSGGVDSSVIAAFAREVRPDVQCFIARVPGDGVEELRRARFVSERLQLPLHEIEFDDSRIGHDLMKLVELLEEPPRNPNSLVLMQLYRAMQQTGVDVALNGDGAEMLLGLADTRRVARFDAKRRSAAVLPAGLRRGLALLLRQLDQSAAWRIARILDTTTSDFAAALDEIDYPPAIRRELRVWGGEDLRAASCPRADLLRNPATTAAFEDALHGFQCLTTLLSTQRRHECIARAANIEAVTPFVHSSVLSFARQLPRALRYTDRSRPVLKRLCDDHVHPDVARWEKLGFSVPWAGWLAGSLSATLEDALQSPALQALLPRQLLRAGANGVSAEWNWTLLTLHAWIEVSSAVEARVSV